MDDAAYVLWLNSDDVLQKRYPPDIVPRDKQFFRLPDNQTRNGSGSKQKKEPRTSHDTKSWRNDGKPDDVVEKNQGHQRLGASSVSRERGDCEDENRGTKKQKIGPSTEDQQTDSSTLQQVLWDAGCRIGSP